MAIIRVSGRGLRTAASLTLLLSTGLLFSACGLFTQPAPAATTTDPVNDVVALVGDSSGSAAAGTHVFSNDGKGNLSVGAILGDASSGYTDLALGNLADHAAPTGGGSPVEDIFVTNNGVSQGKNEVWINDGSGSFTLESEPWSVQNSTAVVLGPVVGISGEVDAIVANGTKNPTTWENSTKTGSFTEYPTGEGEFDAAYSSLGGYNAKSLAIGNLTGNGGTSGDVVFGNNGQQNLVFQDKAGTNGTYYNTASTSNLNSGDNTVGVAIGDLNGNGLPDLFVVNNGSGQQNCVYFNSDSGGNYTLQPSPATVGPTNSSSTAVALGQLTSSGTMYAFVVNSGSADTVWRYNGTSFVQVTETSQFNNATDTTGTAVTLADLNGDGILDAIVASGGSSGTIQVWLGNGDGTFTEKSEPNIPPGNYVAVAAGRLR